MGRLHNELDMAIRYIFDPRTGDIFEEKEKVTMEPKTFYCYKMSCGLLDYGYWMVVNEFGSSQ